MKCPRCRQGNPAGQKFCGDCGARLTDSCPACGAANSPGQKFCGECGAALTPGGARQLVTPDAYTPKHLAERIINSKAALAGERKQVTVLFADLKGSMELLADRGPEEARRLLDPVLERMIEAVHRYEGTVNQVMGDGIMALFGAPLAHEDHAIRACYAALRMQESIARFAEEVFRSHGVPVQVRVGINSGDVLVRAIGSDLHMDYTAVGQTTHLASRMEQMATPGTILLAPATLQLAEGYVEVTLWGLCHVSFNRGLYREARSLGGGSAWLVYAPMSGEPVTIAPLDRIVKRVVGEGFFLDHPDVELKIAGRAARDDAARRFRRDSSTYGSDVHGTI